MARRTKEEKKKKKMETNLEDRKHVEKWKLTRMQIARGAKGSKPLCVSEWKQVLKVDASICLRRCNELQDRT